MASEHETVTIPTEPSPGILMSMAIRYDHALGCPGYYDQPFLKSNMTHAQRLEGTLRQMRQIYEEVACQGFYSEERESQYAALWPPRGGTEEKAK